ncbi:hypothetical protein N9F71_00790 [bacterium]|nr:hypothetical protein [bacterium]
MANEVAKLIFKADTSDIDAAIKRLGYLGKSANDAEQQVGQLGDDAKKASTKVKKLGDESSKAAKKQKGFGAAIANNKGKVLGFAVALTAMVVVINRGLKAVEEAGAEFSIFRARLITATGSVEAASKAFKDLNAFALETPFTLAESVNGFAQLTNLGLNPSRAAMVSFANTSAAMGKDLGQMIEAVADATTFEFERLKEFGIKSSKEGDIVKFTFRGVTTEVQRSATAVQEYLEEIGSTVFAGAAIEQTKTLKGSISNLDQAYGNLAIASGEVSGANDVFAKSNNDLAAAISDPEFQEGMANLATAFAKIKASLIGLSTDAFTAFIKNITTTDVEAIADTEKRIVQANARIAGMIANGMNENRSIFKDAKNNLADLTSKLRELKGESVGTVSDIMGVGAMVGSDAPFSMMDGVANTGETSIPIAPEGMSSADVARQAEVDRIKGIEAEFAEWKADQQMSELDILKEQFLLKEAATQAHFDALIQKEVEKNEILAQIEAEKEIARTELREELDEASFLQQASQGGNTLKFLEKAKDSELKLEEMTGKQKAKLAIGIGGDILAHAAQNSEKAFKLQKGLKIAEAIQNTYSAATGAYSALAPIPVVGPALGAAAAGVAIMSGMANVKAIQATKFNKGGTGGAPSAPSMGGGGGGGGVSADNAASLSPVQETANDEQASAAQTVNVTVDGTIDPSGARRIIEAINEATEDGLEINALVGS